MPCLCCFLSVEENYVALPINSAIRIILADCPVRERGKCIYLKENADEIRIPNGGHGDKLFLRSFKSFGLTVKKFAETFQSDAWRCILYTRVIMRNRQRKSHRYETR